MIEIIKYPEKENWPLLLQRPVIDFSLLEDKVKRILAEVKNDGDVALKKFSKEFDKVSLDEVAVSAHEIVEAINAVSVELKDAIILAKENIYKFHLAQREEIKVTETQPGVQCWRKSVAIEKVGLYIPGGSAPLFSTVLMLAVPATLAGCREIVLCSPPTPEGKLHPAILYTAHICGVTKIFKAGGVQAIGAMAYGTESVPRVYKIFGPGNQYVTCAKQLVNRNEVAIDMPAGPSELAVFADESCVPAFVAADLLSQAEHGADSQVVLVTTTEEIIQPVLLELEKQLGELPRREIAGVALRNSKVILVRDEADATDLLNEYAPEHLIVACKNPEAFSERMVNAGSVFLGNFSCESAGDYASGTNHTLPTNGYAKAYSGVSLDSFVKKITFQKLSETGINNIGNAIELMAEAEGLRAHKNAVTFRLKKQSLKK